MFLLTIVRQMHLGTHLLESVSTRCGAHVRGVIVVYVELRSHQDPHPDVEFTTVVQQWFLYCFLNNPASGG